MAKKLIVRYKSFCNHKPVYNIHAWAILLDFDGCISIKQLCRRIKLSENAKSDGNSTPFHYEQF